MVVVTAIFVAALATFNYITTDKIAFNNENELRQKILYIFDISPESKNSKEIEEIFNSRVIKKQFGQIHGFALIDGNEEIAYAVPIEGAGLWGTITGYVGLNKDFTKTIGIEFVTQSETPGLGGRISEEYYKEQFRNIDITSPVNNNYIISRPQPGGNIDAISGATQTSTAVVNLVNENLYEFFNTMEVKK